MNRSKSPNIRLPDRRVIHDSSPSHRIENSPDLILRRVFLVIGFRRGSIAARALRLEITEVRTASKIQRVGAQG